MYTNIIIIKTIYDSSSTSSLESSLSLTFSPESLTISPESPTSSAESPGPTTPREPQSSTNEPSAPQQPPPKQPRICHSDVDVFFRPTVNFRSDPRVLVMKPLTNFQKALEILNKHDNKLFHRSSVIQMEEFLKVMKNKQPSIRRHLSEVTAQPIATNRQKFCSIVETVLLCGRQNIPLRGHRDSTMNIEHTPNAQYGNFWALVQFHVAAGDTLLRDHIAQSSRNAIYTSSRIQNQILDILGNTVVHKIVQRVRDATYFTVIADEATDCSNKEQLSLVLRDVSPEDNQIRDDFVAFIECDCGITGRALANKILTFLSSHGLDPSKLQGEAYDGAGNMSGRLNGTASLISNNYPIALYLHCVSHSLNLAVVKSLNETIVRNMIGVVTEFLYFSLLTPSGEEA